VGRRIRKVGISFIGLIKLRTREATLAIIREVRVRKGRGGEAAARGLGTREARARGADIGENTR
jgi:hypothetical protein